jgi:hypothetical protein
MIQSIIQKLLIGVHQRIKLAGDGEDCMEVWRIQHIFPSKVDPFINIHALTHWTVPVLA